MMHISCGGGAESPSTDPVRDKWMFRAQESYKSTDLSDALDAAKEVMKLSPGDKEARVMASKIALMKLDYAEALHMTETLTGKDVHEVRARAYWYSGDIDHAAEELEIYLADPEVKDPWAKEALKLARRGHGRHPFSMEGAYVASVDMPSAGPLLILPCELEGERILAIVASGVAELTLDSQTRKEPAWVNMRFGGAPYVSSGIEVKDIPAMTQDLSGLSKQLQAPIKALIGVNLLRHLHPTFDRRGSQFVVRREDPILPSDAVVNPVIYIRGGGMITRVGFAKSPETLTPMLIDTSAPYPFGLMDSVWKLAGVDIKTLRDEPSVGAGYKSGILPWVHIANLDIPGVPAISGGDIPNLASKVDINVGGLIGSGFLQAFRITLTDSGKKMWFETDVTMQGEHESPDKKAGESSQDKKMNETPSAPTTPGQKTGSTPPSDSKTKQGEGVKKKKNVGASSK